MMPPRWGGTDLEAKLRAYSVEDEHGCWIWQRAKFEGGYGAAYAGGGDRVPKMAHRLSYEVFVGPIPEGYEVDHLCFVRACINPAHLEAVTREVNQRRAMLAGRIRWNGAERPTVCMYKRGPNKTHCKRGHPLHGPGADVRISSQGYPRCRACVHECRRRRAA